MVDDDYCSQLRREGKLRQQKHEEGGRDYHYVVATYRGRRVLLGPYATEDEANEIGFEKLDVPFQVHTLPTKDRARATSILKAEVLSETASLGESLRRIRHKL